MTNAPSIRRFRRAMLVSASRMVLVLVALVGTIGTAAAQPSLAWRSASSGVALAQLPSGWHMVRSDSVSLELAKRFVSSDGIWFDESITINVGSQSIGDVESITSKLSDTPDRCVAGRKVCSSIRGRNSPSNRRIRSKLIGNEPNRW